MAAKVKVKKKKVKQREANVKLAKKTSEKYIPQSMLAGITGSTLRRPSANSGIKVIGGPGGAGPTDTSVFAGDMNSDTGGAFRGASNTRSST